MIKENLKRIRQELGLSVAKFAEKLEIPAPTLTCYERGERTPSSQLFIQLYNKLNVNLNWFVSGNGNMFINDLSHIPDFRSEVLKVLKDEGLI